MAKGYRHLKEFNSGNLEFCVRLHTDIKASLAMAISHLCVSIRSSHQARRILYEARY